MQVTSGKEHVFIPGKNWRLSLAELASFLETMQIVFVVREFFREFFEVNIDADADDVAIDGFGGFIKIGVVKGILQTELLKRFFVKKDRSAKSQIEGTIASSRAVDKLLSNAGGKQLFGVSVYCADRSLRGFSNRIQRLVGSSIKKDLATHGIKADFMGFSGDRKLPQLTHVEVLKKQLVEKGAEVLFCIGREQTLIATTTAVHNPFEFQKRDVGKPVERRIFAMPPRLARIMVNLSGCTPRKTFLDPFCGVGTLLQEALLSRARVVGVDLNPWCVKAARENLEWLTREYELKEADFRVLQGDARKLSSRVRDVDCIATEPDLGPALRHAPTNVYAAKIVAKLEPLYFGFLEDIFNVLNVGGRLVMVTPYFQTRSGEPVVTRFAEKAEEVGFKRVFPFKTEFFARDGEAERKLLELASLIDVSERHKVGREIHVFQK
jgi:tRNA G10  N-methylase Trm11